MKLQALLLSMAFASSATAGTIVQDIRGNIGFSDDCDRHMCYTVGTELDGYSVFDLYDSSSQPLNYVTIQYAGHYWHTDRAGYSLGLGFNYYADNSYFTPGNLGLEYYEVVPTSQIFRFIDFPGSTIDNRMIGFLGFAAIDIGLNGLMGVSYAVRLTYGFGDDVIPPAAPLAPIAPIPLPATLPLAAMALSGLALSARRRGKSTGLAGVDSEMPLGA